MDLLAFAEWCENSPLGLFIRESLWQFPVIEAFHLVAFGFLGGTILAVDLRLLNVAFKRTPVSQLSRDVRPWMMGFLGVMLVTGTLLFVSEAVKCYYSNPFWIKMSALFLGIVFTFAVREPIARRDGGVNPIVGALVAVVSMTLWATVAWGGRWIGFSG